MKVVQTYPSKVLFYWNILL